MDLPLDLNGLWLGFVAVTGALGACTFGLLIGLAIAHLVDDKRLVWVSALLALMFYLSSFLGAMVVYKAVAGTMLLQ